MHSKGNKWVWGREGVTKRKPTQLKKYWLRRRRQWSVNEDKIENGTERSKLVSQASSSYKIRGRLDDFYACRSVCKSICPYVTFLPAIIMNKVFLTNNLQLEVNKGFWNTNEFAKSIKLKGRSQSYIGKGKTICPLDICGAESHF